MIETGKRLRGRGKGEVALWECGGTGEHRGLSCPPSLGPWLRCWESRASPLVSSAPKGMRSEPRRGGVFPSALGRIQAAYPCLATALKPISHTHGEVRGCQRISEQLEQKLPLSDPPAGPSSMAGLPTIQSKQGPLLIHASKEVALLGAHPLEGTPKTMVLKGIRSSQKTAQSKHTEVQAHSQVTHCGTVRGQPYHFINRCPPIASIKIKYIQHKRVSVFPPIV